MIKTYVYIKDNNIISSAHVPLSIKHDRMEEIDLDVTKSWQLVLDTDNNLIVRYEESLDSN